MPLTAKAINAAKPKDKLYTLTDGEGMYLEIPPKGNKRWRFKFRFNGKQKRLSFGTYPDTDLKAAREKRTLARKLLANGIDPAAHRKQARQQAMDETENTFENIAREWYAKHEPTWVPSHSRRILQRLERDFFPWLGSTPISALKPADLLACLRRVEERGALETAHRGLQNLGQIFRYGVATGRVERDICYDLRGALPPYRTKHHAAITDPEKLGALLRSLEAYQGTAVVKAALQLAPHVFVRPGELRQAKWDDIDIKAQEWRFIVSKTQTEHIVPLSKQSLSILSELQPLTGHGLYVFPSARSPKGDRPMSDNAVLSALRSLGISKDEVSVHGFRATARTLLDEALGFRPDYIEHQLAHAVRDPNGRAYNRTAFLRERRDMMQAWSDYLDRLREGLS